MKRLLIAVLAISCQQAYAAEWPKWPDGTNVPTDRLLWLNPGGAGLRTLWRGGVYEVSHPVLLKGNCTLRLPVNMVSEWHNLIAQGVFHGLHPDAGTPVPIFAVWHDGHGQRDSLWLGFWVYKGYGLVSGNSTDLIADQGSYVFIDCRHC